MTLSRRIIALIALTAAPLAAQEPTRLPLQSIAVNPLAIPFGVFSAEYEVALPSPGFTLGVGGTYFSRDGDRESWAEVKGMYYPNETGFRGFSVGLTGGVHSSGRRVSRCDFNVPCVDSRRSQTAPTLGVLASYDWLLGRQQRFRVGLGVGAKRVLRDVDDSRADVLEQVYPDGRFVIGFVF